MKKRKDVGGLVGLLAIGVILLCAGLALAETITWTNPTTATTEDGTQVALSEAEQAVLTNYIRYRPIGGTWTYLGETREGKSSWTGDLPLAEGVEADYSVSAALKGADGIERDSWSKGEASHPIVRYARPFPAGPTPAAPGSITITKD